MKLTWLVLATVFISSAASADGKVTQIVRDSKRATVVFESQTNAPHTGDLVLVEGRDGEACEGKITSIKSAKYAVDFSGCSIFDQVKAGSVVTISEERASVATPPLSQAEPTTLSVPPPAPEPYSSQSERRMRLALALFYNGANKLSYNSVSASGPSGSGSGKIIYEMDGSLGFAVEGVYSAPHSWGFNSGVSHDLQKRLTKVTVEEGGSSATENMVGDSYVSLTHVYANALYRWENFYLPFGLNYSFVSLKDTPEILKHTVGRVGLQLGVGWFFTENFAMEIVSRASGLDGGAVNLSGDYFQLGVGVISGAQLTTKFLF